MVNQFCYLGNIISAGGEAEASTIARIRSGWKSFRVLLLVLASRVISFRIKGRLYAACVRSIMVYSSEIWPLEVDDITRSFKADMMTFRWMCNVSLRDGRSSDELRDRLGIPDITEVLCRNRLRWFGHVTRMDADNPASACRHVEVEGKRKQGIPRKTWSQLVSNDFRKMKLKSQLAQDRRLKRRIIVRPRPTHASMETDANDDDDDELNGNMS